MWIKYTGEITYNSMQVRGFKPDTSRSVSEETAKYLLKEFPKLFHPSKPVVEEVVKEAPKVETKEEVVEEVPKVEDTTIKDAKKKIETPVKKGRK